MTSSPDFTQYINLRFFDLDPQDVYEAAETTLRSRLPEWQPREGNTEVLLLESMALEVAEAIFAANRLPDAIMEALLRLYGIERDLGATPTATLRFHISGTTGATIPLGTSVRLDLPGGLDPLVFSTDAELVIPPGATTGDVTATGNRLTADANGVVAGTNAEVLDAITVVDYVTLATDVANGRNAEEDPDYLERGVQRLARLTDTLVLPRHFVQAALEEPYIERAHALDNYNGATLSAPTTVSTTTETTGGTLAVGTYTYRVTAVNANGETLASTPASVTTTGTTSTVTVSWSAVSAGYADPVTNYRVYGRTGGSEQRLAEVAAGTLSWTDTGSVTPSGALPTANTTHNPTTEEAPGHITVAVYGEGAVVSDLDKTALRAIFTDKQAGNLVSHVIDPKITLIPVTVTVRALPDYIATDVINNVRTKLEEYLDPGTWQWHNTVRRFELVQEISNAEGVDYIETLTTPAADTTLTGVANLVDLDPNNINITVNLP